jgi:uncharacterized membrane protein YjjP (DUF1212 family)
MPVTDRDPDPLDHDDEDPLREPVRDPAPEEFPSANELLGTLFEETSLWPLLIVILCSTGAFGAALLVLALGDRNPFAAAALLLLLGMTTDVIIRARRRVEIRNLAKIIALFWAAAIALAVVAVATGIA